MISEDTAEGRLELAASGMDDDHQNCEEKWGFATLRGDCQYTGDENDEPYSDGDRHWEPAHTYNIVFEWD